MELKKKIARSKGAAKQNYKRKALQLLKQKKQYEQQRDKLMGQQMNIDSARFAQESLKDNAEMVKAMKATATVLKDQYKEIDIDAVEDLHGEMQELMEDANEINEVLGETWGMDDFDEDDLLEGMYILYIKYMVDFFICFFFFFFFFCRVGWVRCRIRWFGCR